MYVHQHQLNITSTGGSLTSGSTSLSESQIPNHRHSVSITTSSGGEHTHTLRRRNGDFGLGGKRNWFVDPGTWGAGDGSTGMHAAGYHSHSVSGYTGYIGSGSGHSHSVEPSFVRLAFWRRTV